MLVADDDGRQRRRIFAGKTHAADGFAHRKPRIHQNAGAAAGNDRAIATAAAGEHSDANHQRQNSVIWARMGVTNELTMPKWDLFRASFAIFPERGERTLQAAIDLIGL